MLPNKQVNPETHESDWINHKLKKAIYQHKLCPGTPAATACYLSTFCGEQGHYYSLHDQLNRCNIEKYFKISSKVNKFYNGLVMCNVLKCARVDVSMKL